MLCVAERLELMVEQILDVTRIKEKHMVIQKSSCHIDIAEETHFPCRCSNKEKTFVNERLRKIMAL
ncbi:MAG: hypothetical protein EOM14_08605 [Clostridia bacterium]|nr:hypothetical protein [Clostridia bacterium]